MKAMPIEEHVRGVVKDLLRTRGIAHTGMVTDLNGTKKIPLKGLKYRLSIQVKPHLFSEKCLDIFLFGCFLPFMSCYRMPCFDLV